MMTYFLGHNNLANTIFFAALVILVFLETPTCVAAGKLDLLADDQFFSRDDLVKWAGYGEEKLSTVVIGGKLLCHGGGGAGEKTSVHPHPVSGATVAVVCGKTTKTKKSWSKGSTDTSGSFLIDLPSHLHAIPNLEQVCHVRVLHLPKTSLCYSRRYKSIRLTSVSVGDGIRSYTTNNINLIPHKRT